MDLHRQTSLAIRLLQLGIFLLLTIWIFGYLGGLSLSPVVHDPADPSTNDTSALFNWHPLLMMLAFVGCMTEAIMVYSTAPSSLGYHIPETNRPLKKLVHGVLQCAALLLSVLGIVAAIMSHTLKEPTPMPNFYSTHSALGVLTLVMMVGQGVLGMMAYVAPQWSLHARQAFSPMHRFFWRGNVCGRHGHRHGWRAGEDHIPPACAAPAGSCGYHADSGASAGLHRHIYGCGGAAGAGMAVGGCTRGHERGEL